MISKIPENKYDIILFFLNYKFNLKWLALIVCWRIRWCLYQITRQGSIKTSNKQAKNSDK